MPALSAPSSPSAYSKIDSPKSPKTPPSGNSGSYEYADPNAVGKWSLQHIARGNPVECVYATIPDGYDLEEAYAPVEMPSGRFTRTILYAVRVRSGKRKALVRCPSVCPMMAKKSTHGNTSAFEWVAIAAGNPNSLPAYVSFRPSNTLMFGLFSVSNLWSCFRAEEAISGVEKSLSELTATDRRKAWKTELWKTESEPETLRLGRKLSAVSETRVQTLLAQRWKARKLSAPSEFPNVMYRKPTEMPFCGPMKYQDEKNENEDDDFDDYECPCENATPVAVAGYNDKMVLVTSCMDSGHGRLSRRVVTRC